MKINVLFLFIFRYEEEIARLKGEVPMERPILPVSTTTGHVALSALHAGEKRNSSSASLEEVQPCTRPRESSTGSVSSGTSSSYDWLVTYNPKVPKSLSIDLAHSINFESVVCCVRFSNSGKYLALSGNRVCSIYDATNGNRLATLPHGNGDRADLYVRSVSFSPEDKWFATGSEDHLIRIWPLESLLSGQETSPKLFTGHTQDVYTLEFIKETRLVSGSGDETLRIWDIEQGECVHCLTIESADKSSGREAAITSLAVSHSRRFVVAGSLDKLVRVWELQDEEPKLVQTLADHTDSVYSVCFDKDDKTIISGSLDKTIRRWDFSNPGHGSCLQVLAGHKDFVLSVSVGGKRRPLILSGSKDRSVQFWDNQTDTLQLTLQGHKNSVISVAVSSDGTTFATGSGDGRARIWTLTEKD